MKIWYNNILESESRKVIEVRSSFLRIGRNAENDLVLDNHYVAGEAALLHRQQGAWELVALALDGISIEGNQLHSGQKVAIERDQTITIFPFTLTLELPRNVDPSQHAIRLLRDQELSGLIRDLHLELLDTMDLETGVESRKQNADYILNLEKNLDEIAKIKGLLSPARRELKQHIAGLCCRNSLLEELMAHQGGSTSHIWDTESQWTRMMTTIPDRDLEIKGVIDYLVRELKIDSSADLSERIDVVESGFWPLWDKLSQQYQSDEFQNYAALRYLKKEIKDIVFGYGPLEDLLRTPTVTEIMVVNRDHIYVERGGRVENSGRRFISDKVTETIIERIVSKVGRRIDKSKPLVDARLVDGSRVNAVIPPLAVSGPCITIRKFPDRKLLIEDLVRYGSLNRTAVDFLRAAVLSRRNIVVSGGTGTGKTTLLNCLSDFIPDDERIVTIEDTAELQLKKEHVVRMETKQANIEGEGAYTIQDLVINSLRMRPDRIVVGECRGPEALDMLQAMNTGHDGSLTTIHANRAEDVVLRLETLVQMAADLPIESIHRQISSAIDVIVQLTRMRDGSRKVSQITEVVDYEASKKRLILKDLFLLEEDGERHELVATGRLPTFLGEMIDKRMIELDTFYR